MVRLTEMFTAGEPKKTYLALAKGRFQRDRGTVVRANAIESVTRDEAGKLHVQLRGRPEKLPVSRIYAHLFKAM